MSDFILIGNPAGPPVVAPIPYGSYTAGELLMDILPRVGNLPPTGMTFNGAVNSVTSLIFKRLLEKRSDLLATGKLYAIIPAAGCKFVLPIDFISPAEKSNSTEVENLVTNLTLALVAAGLSPANQITLAAMFANNTGVNVSDIQALCNAQPISVDVGAIIYGLTDDCSRKHRLQPSYLDNEREHHDWGWWDWYGYTTDFSEHHGCGHTMKIINRDFFVRPKSVNDITIKGRYFQKPITLSNASDILPFNSLFDEVYREGTVKIISSSLAMPDADPTFAMFIAREVDSVVNSRSYIGSKNRMRRSDYI